MVFCAAAASVASATPNFKLTEAYTGLSGPDGTADWVEVTNFGTSTGDTSTLWYDDESLDIGSAGQLPSFMLAPGESAVFLVDLDAGTEADEVAAFNALWGAGINVAGFVGGGSLGGGGDTAALLTAGGDVIDTLSYASGGAAATFEDPSGMGTPVLSQLGVNGAFESAPFANENLNPIDPFLITLVGSPGIAVPEPTALGLVLVTLLAGAASRR